MQMNVIENDPGRTRLLPLAGVDGALAIDMTPQGPNYSLQRTQDGKVLIFYFAEPTDTDSEANRGVMDAAEFLKTVSLEIVNHPEKVTSDSDHAVSGVVPYSVKLTAGEFSANFPWVSYEEMSPQTLAENFIVKLAREVYREFNKRKNSNKAKVYWDLGFLFEPRSMSDIVRRQNRWDRWKRILGGNGQNDEMSSKKPLAKPVEPVVDVRTELHTEPADIKLTETEQVAREIIIRLDLLLAELRIVPNDVIAEQEQSEHSQMIETLLVAEMEKLKEFSKKDHGELLAVMLVSTSVHTLFASVIGRLLTNHGVPTSLEQLASLAIVFSTFFATLVGYIQLKDSKNWRQLLAFQKDSTSKLTDAIYNDVNWITAEMKAQLVLSSLRLSMLSRANTITNSFSDYNIPKNRAAYHEVQTLLNSMSALTLKPLNIAVEIIEQNDALLANFSSKELESLIQIVMNQLNQHIASRRNFEKLFEDSGFAAPARAELVTVIQFVEHLHQLLLKKNSAANVDFGVTVIENGFPKRVQLNEIANKIGAGDAPQQLPEAGQFNRLRNDQPLWATDSSAHQDGSAQKYKQGQR